jgi:hypothetical protein
MKIGFATVVAVALACACQNKATSETPAPSASAGAGAGASADAGASASASAGAGAGASASASASASAGASAIPSNAPNPFPDLPAVSYATYRNPRYAFSVDVPTFFTPKPADANGAGQAYQWKTRATMRAWGAVNSSGMSAKAYYEDWIRRPGVTEKKLDGNVWSVTGKDKGRVYFSRCVLADRFLTVIDLEYEETLAAWFLPMSEHIAASFMLLDEGARRAH